MEAINNYNNTKAQKMKKNDEAKLFYRLNPKHFEFDRISLSNELDKYKLYILSIWNNDTKLSQSQKPIKLIPLGDKLIIQTGYLTFYHSLNNQNLTLRLSTYFGDRLTQIAQGQLSMSYLVKHYQYEYQRYYPQFKCSLNFSFGRMVLVFQVYVEKNLYELQNYIKRLRNKKSKDILMIKKISLEKSQNTIGFDKLLTIREENSNLIKELSKQPSIIQQPSNEREEVLFNNFSNKSRENFREIKQKAIQSSSQSKNKQNSFNQIQIHNQPSYLQINSATHLHKQIKKISITESISNQTENRSKQSHQPSATKTQSSNQLGIYDEGPTEKSIISDGSQYSQMIEAKEKESYSSKAVKNFYNKLSKCNNIIMIIAALFLIYLVLMPNINYQKKQDRPKTRHKYKSNNKKH